MALIDLKSNLAQRIGEVNTDDGTFKVKQGDNTERTSQLTELPRPNINTNTLPPEIKGRQQALEAVADVGVRKTVLFKTKQAILHKFNTKEGTRIYDITALEKNLITPTDNISGESYEDQFKNIPENIKKIGNPITFAKDKNGKRNIIAKVVNSIDDKVFQSKVNSELNKLQWSKENELKLLNDDIAADGSNTKQQNGNALNPKMSAGATRQVYNDLPKDWINFRIKDLTTGTDGVGQYIQFPAYLTDITDNSSAEYSPTRYIGRADQVYVYSGYTRNISFGFRVAALQKEDVPILWRKVDKLKLLTLPTYSDRVFPTEDNNDLRPVAPTIQLTIGNLLWEQPGFFTSVNVTIPQTSTWEIQPGFQLPHLCDVSVDFTYIGNATPQNRTLRHHKDSDETGAIQERGYNDSYDIGWTKKGPL